MHVEFESRATISTTLQIIRAVAEYRSLTQNPLYKVFIHLKALTDPTGVSFI